MKLKIKKQGSNLNKALVSEFKKYEKAVESTVKREGFLLRTDLMNQLQSASIGAQKNELSHIQASIKGLFKNREGGYDALREFAKAARYESVDKKTAKVTIGREGSKWRSMAGEHEQGYTRQVTPTLRAAFAHFGEELRDTPGYEELAKYFFLKKSTTTLEAKPRKVMPEFYDANLTNHLARAQRILDKKLREID